MLVLDQIINRRSAHGPFFPRPDAEMTEAFETVRKDTEE